MPGRQVDDNAHVLLRFEGGARGMLWSSQVAPGNENALKIRVYGEKGGLEWAQEDPNLLWYTPFGEPKRLITRNGAGAGEAGRGAGACAGHGGHPRPRGYSRRPAGQHVRAHPPSRGHGRGDGAEPLKIGPLGNNNADNGK